MKLIIDIENASKIGITPLELMYLNVLHYNLSTELDFSTLMELGYIGEGFKLTNAGSNVVAPKVSDEMMLFVKTYDEYPHKVGNRVLKSKSIDSADGRHCLSKFKHYIKNDPDLPEKMYRGLLIEKSLKKKGGSEQYFQDIRTWFNQMTWDKYCHLDIDTDSKERVERI